MGMDPKDPALEEAEQEHQEFEIGSVYLGTPQEVIEQMEKCPVCGSRLVLKYFCDFTNLVTQEKAKCFECGIRVRNCFHGLQ